MVVDRTYTFGSFVLNVTERQLLKSGEQLPLTPKAFETLSVLVSNHGHMVSKKDLLQRVWPDSIVEENNLSQNISFLRKLLGGQGDEFIATVPKHGYRFISRVSEGIAAIPAPQADISSSGDSLRAQQGCKHCVSGPRRRPDRSCVRDGLGLPSGVFLDGALVRTIPAPACDVFPSDFV